MKLVVTTPTAVIIDAPDVAHVRAEDETGAFGILPGHADFLTVLTISVITWRDRAAGMHQIAVRGGLLTVRDGDRVEVATLDAVGEETLQKLGRAVLERFQADARAETESRVSTRRLQLATIRQLQRFLHVDRQTAPLGAPPRLEGDIAQGTSPGAGEMS